MPTELTPSERASTERASAAPTTSSTDGPKVPTLRTAAAWSYGLTLGRMAITTGLSLVLAAMLGPRAFGVIAMALVFTNLIEMLQQQGLMPAIISRKELRDEHADTAFWLVIGASTVLTGLGIALAPVWAAVNGLPELTGVVQLLALAIPLTSSVVVQEAMLRRQLQFKKLAIRSWVSVLAGGVGGLAAAFAGWGVWALVIQQLVMGATAAVVLWTVASWRPRFRFSGTAARELWSYSVRSASSSLGLFLGNRVDIILSGAFFGPIVVGLYRMGHRLNAMVLDTTARSMQAVSLPGLSALQHDPQAFATRLLRMQRFTASLALPALALLAGIAPVAENLLGEDWSGTTVAIRLLAIGQAFSAVTLLLGPALQARGRPGTLSVVVWIWSASTAVVLVAASLVPAAGDAERLRILCVAMVCASVVGAILMVAAATRVFDISVWSMARSWLPGGLAALATVGTSALVVHATGLPVLVGGLVAATAGLLAGLLVLAAVEPTVRAHALRVLSASGNAVRRSSAGRAR